MAKPYLPNIEHYIGIGVDPKTGLPMKAISSDKKGLKEAIKRQLRIKEENEFVNRFVWYNLPSNVDSAMLERMLYYKGQLCFFYSKELEEFFFAPYALNGTIDYYGRYNSIRPVPWNEGTTEDTDKAQAELFADMKYKVKYGIVTDEEMDIETFENSAVILRDYTNQFSQMNISRQILNDNLLDAMAECIPLMRTRLILGTGVKGVRVNDADQADSVKDGAKSLENAAMTGDAYVPIVGNIEFQELSDNAAGKSEEYMLAYQSLDNFRKETLGIPSGGVFEKKAHTLESEQAMNGSNVDLVLADGLQCRQNFCNIVNSIWGLGIWCDINQAISMADIDGDGLAYEENEGENSGAEGEDNDSSI